MRLQSLKGQERSCETLGGGEGSWAKQLYSSRKKSKEQRTRTSSIKHTLYLTEFRGRFSSSRSLWLITGSRVNEWNQSHLADLELFDPKNRGKIEFLHFLLQLLVKNLLRTFTPMLDRKGFIDAAAKVQEMKWWNRRRRWRIKIS